MVGTVDDEHPDAGLVCPSVYRPTSLLLLVRADPAEFALRLPSVSPGKNGRIAAKKVRTRLIGRFVMLSPSISLRTGFAKHLCLFPWQSIAEMIRDSSPATAGSE
jgi:hypothetical protein